MKSRIAWLAVLPVAGLLSGGYLSQQVPPLVFGLPFLLLWNSGWVLATSVVLTLIYRFDPENHAEDE